ncbi:MAG: MIP/aquaporin family protein [Candidatus Thalassarchaeaceae archaeon]
MSEESDMNAKLITEFIGTFFLCLTICVAGVFGLSGPNAPFAIAGTLMVMIYAGAHISGAHYNPAVTISIWIRGSFDKSEVLPYAISQLVAGFLAALIAANLIVTGSFSEDYPIEMFEPSGTETSIIVSELLFTFALVFVILNVATTESNEGNGFYGAAIALVVLAGALTVGDISLASFNPAVSISLVAVGKMAAADLWLHLAPQLFGASAASLVFKWNV